MWMLAAYVIIVLYHVCLLQQYYVGNITASINQSSYKWKVM